MAPAGSIMVWSRKMFKHWQRNFLFDHIQSVFTEAVSKTTARLSNEMGYLLTEAVLSGRESVVIFDFFSRVYVLLLDTVYIFRPKRPSTDIPRQIISHTVYKLENCTG